MPAELDAHRSHRRNDPSCCRSGFPLLAVRHSSATGALRLGADISFWGASGCGMTVLLDADSKSVVTHLDECDQAIMVNS